MDCVLFHSLLEDRGSLYLYVPMERITSYLNPNETLEDFCEAFRTPNPFLPERFRTFLKDMEQLANDGKGVARILAWVEPGERIPGVPKGVRVIEYSARMIYDY